MQKIHIITPLHTATKREYLPRMIEDKVACMRKAKEYEFDYWDGDRRYGYGGYRYDGRWKPVAQSLIDVYSLKNDACILDVGCGKAHLLFELGQLLPNANLIGFDISQHGLANAPEMIRDRLFRQKAQEPYPHADDHFDLVISLNALHNLELPEFKAAITEIERVGKQKYVCVESYRNEQELFNLQCWALTCESFFSEREWVWLYQQFGYTGDYEFIFFE
ncbi:class I SAM-dependent methyltransferase [Desulfobacter vibrioformis]|uniref:class I SAM-dependent methyltransferase n=1 Tax=Desulfobacter vibrioformis TaxID=34031 RepID=UPI00054E969E|nr:class I SAM-dependent methyltransferase [Desulfobacter vibrioformis]